MYLGIQLLWLLRSTRRLEGLIGLLLVDFDSLGDWLMYEIDDVGVMLEGGVGVAAIYSCAT